MGLRTSPTCLRMTASFRNKCSKRSDRLLKWYAKVRGKETLLSKVSTSTAFAFSLSFACRPSWYQLQHLNLLFTGAATVTVQLLIFGKLATKWSDYERHPFYMLLFWLRIDRQLVTDQSPLSCNQSPIIHRLFADRSQQIASLSPYVRLPVADRSPINRWQVATPVAD